MPKPAKPSIPLYTSFMKLERPSKTERNSTLVLHEGSPLYPHSSSPCQHLLLLRLPLGPALPRCLLSSWLPSKGKAELPCGGACAAQKHPCKVLCFSQPSRAILRAVRRRGGGEDVERKWRGILKGDNEREGEGSGGNATAGAPFPLACLR